MTSVDRFRRSSCSCPCLSYSPENLQPRLHVSSSLTSILSVETLMCVESNVIAYLILVGSILMLLSVALLRGPWAHVKHMMSIERLPFTAAYIGTMVLTLYFSLGVSLTTWLR